MASDTSVLQPPHAQWLADLTKAAEPLTEASIGSDLNAIDDVFVEVSRGETRQRGFLLAFSIFGVLAFLFPLWLFGPDILSGDIEEPLMMLFLLVLVLGGYLFFFFGIRLETSIPRDEPVRFNRKTGKVYVNEFHHTQNPFGKWGSNVKVYDWSNIHGELISYLQFNTRFFVRRYGLEAAVCKPGTTEVVERFWIERNQPFPDLLRGKWAYICAFMNGTPVDDLPPAQPRDQRVTWRNSFLMWAPWLVQPREHFLSHPLLFFMSMLMVPFTPLFLVAVAGHYIAMRFSPPAQWPADIDRESRASV